MSSLRDSSPVKGRLLLAVSSVGHRHPLLTPLRLHGADVEHEVGVDDAGARLTASHHPTVLTKGIAHSTHVKMILGHLDLSTHGLLLALVLAVGMPTVLLEEHLVLLTFSVKRNDIIAKFKEALLCLWLILLGNGADVKVGAVN